MKINDYIASLFVALLTGTVVCHAQGFEPRDTWPYIYKDFTPGHVYTQDGREIIASEVNVSVFKGSLNYIQDGTIMAADMSRVSTVRIGEKSYVNVMGRMMEVLASSERGYVVKEVIVDKDAMGKTSIGYGISSSTASSQNVTTLLDGSVDMVNLSLSDAMNRRQGGEVIPVKEVIYLKCGIDVVQAYKKEVLEINGVDKGTANAFFKSESIKWKDPLSLIKVVDFIYEQKNRTFK